MFLGRLYVKRAGRERYVVLGQSGTGRLLALVVARAAGGVVRVISARDMALRERRLYERRRK